MTSHRLPRIAASLALSLAFLSAHAADEPFYGSELEGFAYPAPVRQFNFTSQGVKLHMAYMDIAPQGKANGRTVVLLHGKNFCGATWETSMKALSGAGYRVVVPDQIGFCKSSKPQHYQYSFQQLADNTHALLASIGVTNATVMGHSTGGMLAVRYGLLFPRETEALVLVNPIGLEDWKALGVPSLGVDKWYARELQTTAEKIRNYEKATYYVNQWKPEYEPWVQMLAGMYRGPRKELVAWNSALIYDMIYTQPVVYEFPLLSMPTLLLIGLKDTTAIGKDAAPESLRRKLGNYAELAKKTAKAIPRSTLVTFPDMGHAPQMQDPKAFHVALLKGLAAQK
ncbi:alpha/beta hydrolase [Massilia sp. Dwa41.01b]|uniref:alpha/beta fold hydrolase n=1 Tax=unclassified Massilia TaxID=2609279 RepID=UPI001603D5A2|nr:MULTISPECIES: alpha/beta hydrolase [unclassified Massilia]QNA90240.1 alpha/beta hydrolase [Massilia sp. Dwa41.01b]QNB01133.1 alpha/beta hydrolase [Massilia sp. Se16.2.3]